MLDEKGRKEFTIGIAGVGISFLFDRDLSELDVEATNRVFSTDIGEDIKLHVHHGHVPELIKKEKIFDTGHTWAFYRSDGKYVLQDDALESGSSPNTYLVLEPDFKSGDIYHSDDSFNQNLLPDPLGYPLNQILMILLLSRSKGILLHACGIDDRGSGYLFLGNSGHGKSTMAKLWFEKHATVLNDDRIVVREKNGEFWMYGTPWHGDFKELSPMGLAIHKIFFLHRGEKNLTVFQKGAEAVTMLLTRSFPPLWDKKGMAHTMGLCHRIVNKIPCYNLSFEPDTRIVDFLRNM
ncbi:MAG: hypothetical protein ISS66_21110 [Desulfobacteraceae bacterium]|nr:hypothetical protein [Desulfobacteraceae bacterium]